MPLVFFTLSSRFRGYTRRLDLTDKPPPAQLQVGGRDGRYARKHQHSTDCIKSMLLPKAYSPFSPCDWLTTRHLLFSPRVIGAASSGWRRRPVCSAASSRSGGRRCSTRSASCTP
eukprot:7892147-Pyramimonas_sp.AAC.1